MDTEGLYGAPALERLRFRRQFFLGPEFLPAYPSWQRLEVARTVRLTVHPDLDAYQAVEGNRSITLLGYLLDPNHPAATNAAIVDALLARLARGRDLWRHTMDFGGRWVLVVHDGTETILFHDPAGARSIYYARPAGAEMAICASQPGLIAEALSLAMDPEAVEFIASRGHDDNEIYWMPGDTSVYREVRAVLANHFLDLRSGPPRRFWPDADLPRLAARDALVESSRLLRGLMLSARQRFKMALSMTAGWDSRIMLALSRDLAPELYCFTLTYPGFGDSRDVWVPARLLRQLGVAHSIIPLPDQVRPDFRDIYQRNVASATTAYHADAQAVYERCPAGLVCITGDIAEIVKCYYRLERPDQPVTARDLAELCKFGIHPFLVRACEAWLSGASTRNVPLLDLFCWEQMAGKWQALIRAQYDIVQESFAPFNCRSLLVTMLAVEEEHRCPPEYRLLRELIEELWAGALAVPINPPERVRLKRAVIEWLSGLRVYQRIPRPIRQLGKRLLKWS